MKIIARGAEAIIYKRKDKVVKDRVPKAYRHPDLDSKLIRRRTKSEGKILKKASKLIPVPKLLADPKYGRMIHMSYIKGKKLSDHLDKLSNSASICKQIGKSLAILHDAGLIHGDLTTSNLILSTKSPSSIKLKSTQKQNYNYVYFIDFGLGFHSNRIEDKAVDLHLIKQALEAKHSKHFKKYFDAILTGYKKSKNYQKTMDRLKIVESRGRYKKN